jgi:hypothetical protein
MTPADWDALDAYLRRLGDALGLRDWDLRLDRDDYCDDANEASVTPAEGRKIAVIRVGDDFREMPPTRQRWAIAHELTHCHLAPADDLVRRDMKAIIGASAFEVLYASFTRATEYGVDGIARAVAEFLPLIEWPAPAGQDGQSGA